MGKLLRFEGWALVNHAYKWNKQKEQSWAIHWRRKKPRVRPHGPCNLPADVQEAFLPAWRQKTLGTRANGLTTAAESLAFGLQLFDGYSAVLAVCICLTISDNKAWASHGSCLIFFCFFIIFLYKYIFVCQSFDSSFNLWHLKGVKNLIALPFQDGSEMPTVEWMVFEQA